MPYQIKNGIIYSGNAVTLTQAQYDALPTIQKNNGTVYYIYDSNDIVDAEDVGVNGGNVEDLAGSVATFETSQATSAHAEGEYILYQANLYKVIAPIDSGETLTVGSNIESAKVGDELSELKSGLTWQQVVTGSGIVNADFTGYSELYIVVKWSNNVTIRVGLFIIQQCLDGAFIMGKNDHSVRIDVSTSQVKVTEWNYNGTNYGASCPIVVYGR